MATLHVRDVPDELYEQIRHLAQGRQRSLSAEVVFLLQQAVAENLPSQAEVLARVRRRRRSQAAQGDAPSSLELLREDRQR